MSRDITDDDHFKSTVTLTVEIIHQFPGSNTPDSIIRNALNFPAIAKLTINSIETVEVKA